MFAHEVRSDQAIPVFREVLRHGEMEVRRRTRLSRRLRRTGKSLLFELSDSVCVRTCAANICVIIPNSNSPSLHCKQTGRPFNIHSELCLSSEHINQLLCSAGPYRVGFGTENKRFRGVRGCEEIGSWWLLVLPGFDGFEALECREFRWNFGNF